MCLLESKSGAHSWHQPAEEHSFIAMLVKPSPRLANILS